MKKPVLILAALVPVVVGYLANILCKVPLLDPAAFYLLPLLTTVFWFHLGKEYARIWNPISALLIAHSVGFCSLSVYLWQFLIETDETRNATLAAFSQMYSVSTPQHLFVRLAMRFESQPHYIGKTTFAAMQVIALVYLMIVFSIGYYWGKRQAVPHK